jgi:diadenosine tetraphosphate (Ap4A) HIT family hydrolase
MSCPFCSIRSNPEEQTQRVIAHSDDWIVMAVLHPEIKGHCIVFPKRHISTLTEDISTSHQLFETGLMLAPTVIAALGAPAFQLKINNNVFSVENTGNHVGHIHLHIIPRFHEGDAFSLERYGSMEKYFDSIVPTIRAVVLNHSQSWA